MKKKQLIIVIAIVLVLTPLLVLFMNQQKERKIATEIQYVKDEIASDSFAEYDIENLETEEAQKFATDAFWQYLKMKDAYPEPVVTIVSPYEVNDDGVYVIKTGNGDTSFMLQFTVKTSGEELGDVLENVPVFDSTTAMLQVANRSYEGVYSYTVDLPSKETDATLTGKNKYKEVTLNLQITRKESADEKDLRLKSEQAEQEWAQSAEGQICTKHPDWSDYACEELANHKVWIGMTLDMLKYLRGNPSSTNAANYGAGNSYQYCWYRSTPMCFYDEDGDGAMDSYN